MKKIVIGWIIVFLGLSLLGCNEKAETLRVIVPSGSPALAQLYLQEDAETYDVDVVNGADPLVAAFGSGSHEIIYAPTNLGAKMIQSGADYQFAGAVVWGNYYIIGKTDSAFTLAFLAGKTVVVFGQNQTSDLILRYVLAENDINVTFQYVDAVTTATAQFLADDSLIILTAEPSLSVLMASQTGIDVIDLQNEYQKITGSDSYPQAGVFVKSDIASSTAESILQDLETSIQKVNDFPLESATLAVSLGYAFSESVLVSAIPNSHLLFADAMESRPALEAYFSMILETNAGLIGGTLPSEDFYWIP